MKKIILLLLLTFFSISGYSQFFEGFEGTTGPDALPSTNWTLTSGSTGNQWAVFDNGVGTGQRWGINAFAAAIPYQGSNCASVSREFLSPTGATSEDYLATPLITVPTNGQLHFYTRSFSLANEGTTFIVKVAPASAVQTNPAAYTALPGGSWDETTLTATYNVYEEKVVDLSAYAGQQIYIAFEKSFTQTTGTISGDRWLVDNVSVVTRCLDPTTPTANTITQTSANLTWGNPSGATSWEIEIVPTAGTPTGVGTVYSGTLPFVATATTAGVNFTPNTGYKYYVRALCSTGASSLWIGPTAFTTARPGLTCISPIAIGALPYSTTDNTSNYGDTTDVAQPTACVGAIGNYMTGNDVFYAYSPTTSGNISVTMTPTATYSSVFVYDGCSNVGTACLGGVANTGSGVRTIPSIAVVAGHQYIIVVSSNANLQQTVGYTLVIQAVTCSPPTTLSASNMTLTSAQLSWANPSGATSWEVAVQAAGSPIPSGSGVQTNINTNYPANGLTANTAYQYYVRADCGNGTFSPWAGPFLFSTTPGLSCSFPITVGTLPYTTTDNTANYGDNPAIEGSPGASGCGSTNAYLNGNDVVYSYTAAATGTINVAMLPTTTADTYTGIFAYNSCAGIGTSCLAGVANSGTGVRTFDLPVTAGTTYYFVISTWASPQTAAYTLTIQVLNCASPTTLSASAITYNAASLSWGNPSGATSWEVAVQTAGSAIPTGAGTQTSINTNYPAAGLNPSTAYQYYVRADCGNGTFSPWAGPFTFTTSPAPPVCGGTFVNPPDPNQSGNYPNLADVTYTICPNNPGDVVTLSFTSFGLEANYDGLYIYDGNSITAPQIASTNPVGFGPMTTPGAYWGTTIPGPFTSSSPDGCLTVRFRSDGSGNLGVGWSANVTCGPGPNCAKPTALTATNITSTSATLGWTEPNSAVVQWEVIYVPFGSPVPLPSATGTIVSANPAQFTGLTPGTQYTFYVRGLCPTSGTSAWSAGANFTTLIINDNCSGAIFAPVNSSAICQQVTPGTINGATASTPAPTAPCIGTADDDVWFQFVASNPFLNVALQDIVGSTTNLNFGVYSGQCGALTQVFCSAANTVSAVVNGLTIGQTYFIRVYSNGNTAQTANFNLCITTPSSCIGGQAACQNLSYHNTTGVTSQGTIGCLFTSPNPTYYTINVETTGPINLLLTQSTTQGGAPNLDVDYAAWGPFANQAAACAAIGNPPTLAPGIGVAVTTTTGCSYSPAATENLNIANATAGQVYVILITNFSNQPGYVSLTQTNTATPGHGVYECCPDAYFTYNPVTYCKAPGVPNPIPTINAGSTAGTFSLSPASPTGLVFANTATGEVDLQNSAPGNYLILNDVAATPSCAAKQRGFTISIVAPSTATIAYSAASYCKNITTDQTVIFTGTTGGTYAATPNGGLYINANTGAINPSLSAPGVYTVSYALPGSSVCIGSNPTAQVEILPQPAIAQPATVVACDSYTLPTLTVGDYYTQSQLGGASAPLDPTVALTTNQTVYIYAVDANGCTNEKSFAVMINPLPVPVLTVTQPTCANQTGAVDVAPVNSSASTPSNLFISEVTDEDVGSLTYIEIYNGTGAAVNLSNYKLRVFNNGSSTASCDNALSGTLNNNSTYVVAVGSTVNQGGVVPNQVFATCGGVNIDDCIKLTTTANAVIDLWGRTDGVAFTPANQPGYTYRRLQSASHPSTTWNAADWTAIDPQDYTNVGSYTYLNASYEYALDTNPYQASPSFTSIAPGDHTITVHDLLTGCYSAPSPFTLTIVGQNPSVTTFTYTTPVCKNATPNPTPDTTATGFTTGGLFSEITTTGLVFVDSGTSSNSTTGEIDLANSTPGLHTIQYTVLFNATTCQAASTTTFDITINPVITPVVGFSYTTPVCQLAVSTLTPTLDLGFTTGGTFTISPTTGIIDATTGVIDVTHSPANTYTVVYTVGAIPSICQVQNQSAGVQVVIKGATTPNVDFSYASPICDGQTAASLPIPGSTFVAGGVYSCTNSALLINATTGEINVASAPGSYTIDYTLPQDNSLAVCQFGNVGHATVVISPPIDVNVTGDCVANVFTLTANPVNNSFDPTAVTYEWRDAQGAIVGTNSQTLPITVPGLYTVRVILNGCSGTDNDTFPTVICQIQRGISVNGDGMNDVFDLTGLNVKKLTIFNRYGMKAYSKSPYTNQWGGQTDSGEDLPDGTYYYVIERDNGETKTGWIYINRAQ